MCIENIYLKKHLGLRFEGLSTPSMLSNCFRKVSMSRIRKVYRGFKFDVSKILVKSSEAYLLFARNVWEVFVHFYYISKLNNNRGDGK